VIAAPIAQLDGVRERYPGASVHPASDGGYRLHVPGIVLPPGWSLSETSIWVVVPPGFPNLRPDCFFADVGLRLASGVEPASSSIQPLDGTPLRWFSWHLSTWDGSRDGLVQYVRFVERRLSDVR